MQQVTPLQIILTTVLVLVTGSVVQNVDRILHRGTGLSNSITKVVGVTRLSNHSKEVLGQTGCKPQQKSCVWAEFTDSDDCSITVF